MPTKLERFLATPERRTPPDAKISGAFVLPSGEIRAIASHVLSVIDRVHRGGDLPIIAIEKSVAKARYAAKYDSVAGAGIGGLERAHRILLSLNNPTPSLSLCHEIGHFIDCNGWLPCETASEIMPNPAFQLWFSRVIRSDAIRDLRRMAINEATDIFLADGGFIEVPTNDDYIGYLLRSEEMWARSYAQYIAITSQNTTLLKELAIEREFKRGQIFYPKQWTERDFEPILEAIERILRERGWLS